LQAAARKLGIVLRSSFPTEQVSQALVVAVPCLGLSLFHFGCGEERREWPQKRRANMVARSRDEEKFSVRGKCWSLRFCTRDQWPDDD